MTTSYIGQRLKRFEDPPLLQGQGSYVDDKKLPDMLHCYFLRSPIAHARIRSIDTSEALAMEGVEAVFTADDVASLKRLQSFSIEGHDMNLPLHPILADGRVCYVGQTIALVAANDRYLARDAAERIKIDYEPLPVITDPVAAVEAGATLVHEHIGTNAPMQVPLGSTAEEMEAVKAQAHVVVSQNYHIQRITAAPMEGRAVLAIYDEERDHLTFYTSTQVPHIVQEELGRCLERDKASIRVIAPDVGGGFGQKGDPFPEEIAMAHMAITLGKPIKWVETRSENMAASQARGYHTLAEAAADAEGHLLGLHVKAIADVGAFFIGTTVVPPYNSLHRTIGPYRAPVVQMEVMAVTTNKPTTSPYRGAGGPEGAFAMERTMDLLAKELGMDPAEIRRINMLTPDAFPYTTPTGYTYDSGNFTPALQQALDLADYAGLREQQRNRDPNGPLMGVGISTFMKATGGLGPMRDGNSRVEVDPDGAVRVYTEVSPHGQGQETSFAQVTADVLGITPAQVKVHHGDTDTAPFGWGSIASRGTPAGGSAIYEASQKAKAHLDQIASDLLECATEDVQFSEGQAFNQSNPEQTVTFEQVASNLDPGTNFEAIFSLPLNPFSFGAHIVAVELDRDTGEIRFLKYATVQDCGTQLNPMLVEAQVEGSIAQGLGQALMEEHAYSADGQPLNGTFLDYAMPTAEDMPPLDQGFQQTPSPANPLGVKGIGEVATVGAPPAIAGAIVDALSRAGVRHIDTPITTEKVWQALQQLDE
jgi:carbon-monoxide dehydrogenase large subunit